MNHKTKTALRFGASALIVLLGGCEFDHSFREGQCVQMKLDGLKGSVYAARQEAIWVRFSTLRERTNTKLFGNDGDIEKAPYALVVVRPFELKHCT